MDTISPNQQSWYEGHTDDALAAVVETYTARSLAMAGHPLADEAMQIATAAWAEQTRRAVETDTERGMR